MAGKSSPVDLSKHADTAAHQNKQAATDKALNSSATNSKMQAEAQQTLTIRAANGKVASLTSNQLESWFAAVEKQQQQTIVKQNPTLKAQEVQNDPDLATQFISRYGFQNVGDLIKFLNSPAGDTLKEMIGAEIARIADQEDFQRQQFQNEAMRRHLMLAFLLMGLAKRRAAHAKELMQQDELLRQQALSKSSTTTTDTKAPETEMALRKTMESYLNTAKIIKTKLESTHKEIEDLEKQKLTLKDEAKAIDARYDIYDEYLDQMNDFMHLLTGQPSPQRLTALQQQQNQLSTATPVGQTNIPGIAAPYDQAHLQAKHARNQTHLNLWNGPALDTHDQREQFVISKLMQLTDMIAARQSAMVSSINNFTPVDTVANSEIFGLQVFEKQLKNIRLQMANGRKVVQKDGEFYLIGVNEDLQDLNADQRSLAKQSFANEIQSGVPQRSDIARNKAMELARQRVREEEVNKLYDQKKAHATVLQNKHSEVMADHAAAEQRYKEQFGNQASPAPKPTPGTTASNKPKEVTSSYKTMLASMQPNATMPAIAALKAKVASDQSIAEQDRRALQKEINDKLRPNQPISPVAMNALLGSMARFGLNPEKPDVTSYSTPSPLSMKPRIE